MDQRSGTSSDRKNGGSISAGARRIEERAEEQLENLRERFGEANQRIVRFIRDRPGTAILIALGAGFLVGRILRS